MAGQVIVHTRSGVSLGALLPDLMYGVGFSPATKGVRGILGCAPVDPATGICSIRPVSSSIFGSCSVGPRPAGHALLAGSGTKRVFV